MKGVIVEFQSLFRGLLLKLGAVLIIIEQLGVFTGYPEGLLFLFIIF